jgi:hypothetical protein
MSYNAVRLALVAPVRGPPILPDDGAVNRAPARPVPQQRRFALIGDADGGNIARLGAGIAHGAPAGFERGGPQILGRVLDLAVGREMLRKLALGKGRDRGVGPEKNGPRRGRALVDR